MKPKTIEHHILQVKYGYMVRVYFDGKHYNKFFKKLRDAKAQRDDWLAQIEEKYEEEGGVSVFDSSLYTRYRLPTGLDLFHRAYTLQRASHARDWVQPGGRDGGIFEGMTIALALGKEEQVW